MLTILYSADDHLNDHDGVHFVEWQEVCLTTDLSDNEWEKEGGFFAVLNRETPRRNVVLL